ncbi:hypothetical protein N8016_03430 [Pelagibacteraceae bacterium]|nr:hypothetical protein [Pelagibacteraceae bacterium]
MKKFLAITVLGLLWSGNVIANPVAKLGAYDCGFILEYKDKEQTKVSVEDWLNGALTALQLGRETLNKENVPSNSSRYYWVVKYCEENPLEDIAEAAAKLYMELKNK